MGMPIARVGCTTSAVQNLLSVQTKLPFFFFSVFNFGCLSTLFFCMPLGCTSRALSFAVAFDKLASAGLSSYSRCFFLVVLPSFQTLFFVARQRCFPSPSSAVVKLETERVPLRALRVNKKYQASFPVIPEVNHPKVR